MTAMYLHSGLHCTPSHHDTFSHHLPRFWCHGMMVMQAEVSTFPQDTNLRQQLEREREAFRVASIPNYEALASLIAAAGPSADF